MPKLKQKLKLVLRKHNVLLEMLGEKQEQVDDRTEKLHAAQEERGPQSAAAQ